jgi:hypothetical protein
VKWAGDRPLCRRDGYGISDVDIAYGEAEIKVVDFSGLDAAQKRSALEAANAARYLRLRHDAGAAVSRPTPAGARGQHRAVRKIVDQASRTKS